ncbi:hypothetical protein C8R43DRAFT_984470 [Mycena crocata]|nr:hypothetical protein C8R43DRAFT_984470 [Mycena crocata]
MSGFLDLPEELVEAIVEDIDAFSLKQLSTVSKFFVPACQRRHFRTGKLALPKSKDCSGLSFPGALDLFTASPHLAAYVHHISIYFFPPENELTKESDVDAVVRLLPSLKSLAMGLPGIVGWDEIPADLARSIFCLIRLPTLRSLHLTYLDGIPWSLVTYAVRGMSQLTLSQTSLGDSNRLLKADPSPAARPPLTHLTISFIRPNVAEFFLCDDTQSALHSLELLDLLVNGRDPQFLCGWHPASLLTLKHLVLRSAYNRALSIDMHLPLIPNLETIELRLELGSARYVATARPEWKQVFAATLAAMSFPASTPALRCLRLTVFGGGYITESNYIPFAARLFATPDYTEHLPHLRQVHCRMESDVPSGSLEGFIAYMNATFTGPREAGILVCETALLKPHQQSRLV